MHLSKVIKDMAHICTTGDLNRNITSIAYRSSDVEPGSLFIAITGFVTDGHTYINHAIERGAAAIIAEKDIKIPPNVANIRVKNSRQALARVAANFHEHPSTALNMIGITGTNGKTSITHFIKHIFDAAHKKTSLIGTMGTLINDEPIHSDLTTPEAPKLQKLLKQMVKRNSTSCIMEVSSHAIDLQRVNHIHFNTAIFTNLTPDHLELHGDMETYFRTKAKLFNQAEDFNIINVDDPYGRRLADEIDREMLVTYGIHQNAHIYPTDIKYSVNGTTYTAHTPIGQVDITIHLPGEIYVYNSLAAIACAFVNGISLDIIREGLDRVTGIKGRLETVFEQNDFRVLIDFAHTEDALKQTLKTIKPYVKGQLILVFGVYADDSPNGRKKRQGMGNVAAQYADYAVVTLDNPKTHNQDLIMNDICDALKAHDASFKSIKDREEAIRHAITTSNDEDTIVLAGKGHESTQIIGSEIIPFNETKIILDAIKTKQFNQITS
ncbi:UDP-N-acetylmuramoyl-L-alanyl-D-glutamate--2,6-diaminopimelate ligase [Lentibacillus saliphilus]|uniref:UDP-N-acetylmuramoyl-L-alanyl-D-glutamate--2, 6-diaminopimelate ligase n=1 Tax=Lentibacillus saliphilus TaxID=2737028 RepID=UPI001C30B22B|nr:UDP-N-acetylmuramoyl-L-alanyl-D-glutamate--2,6-diaminopimelate ligase [Lentibacillus saliphilus]